MENLCLLEISIYLKAFEYTKVKFVCIFHEYYRSTNLPPMGGWIHKSTQSQYHASCTLF